MSEKILVRGVNWIGDAVMTLPALKALRKAYPESKMSLLVKPAVAAIFEKDPSVDEIILYEERVQGPFGKLVLSQRLRKGHFSRAILLQNAFDAALITFLAGIPERMGYNRDGRGFLLTKAIAFNDDDRKMHHIDYYLNLLRALGIHGEKTQPWIHLSLEERLNARDALSGLKRPVLGINPGAAYGSAKRWLPDRFAEVADWFMKDTGGSVIIFGGKSEEGVSQEIEKMVEGRKSKPAWALRRQSGGKGEDGGLLDTTLTTRIASIRSEDVNNSLLNLAGKTSLRELISIISECDVFLSNDSGPMHLAYAVGTPLVALFGSTDPGLTGAVGEGSVVIHHPLSCSPCFERTCREKDLRCMYSITSDEVFLAIKKMLPKKSAIFFDRDGTLCEDPHYLSSWDRFKLFQGVDELVKLKSRGFQLIGVTNQSGIARGLVGEGFVKEVNHFFIERYGFDNFLYCPHLPEEYCSCRKPEPGMLHTARSRHGIDLRKSFVIGDKEVDMMLAKAVGAKGVLVRTGQDKESSYADFVAENLQEAIRLVE
jgi:heptosyltransferase-2